MLRFSRLEYNLISKRVMSYNRKNNILKTKKYIKNMSKEEIEELRKKYLKIAKYSLIFFMTWNIYDISYDRQKCKLHDDIGPFVVLEESLWFSIPSAIFWPITIPFTILFNIKDTTHDFANFLDYKYNKWTKS